MKNLFTAILLLISIIVQAQHEQYSWEKQQAKVLPNGDLEWAPEKFQFEAGSSVRYIDYENGDDTNDGLSTSTPWKHHPWDPEATGNAGSVYGIHTYIFKRGVVYRGTLTKLGIGSGKSGNPVRLTSDPDWGEGEAAIYGSVKIEDGWIQADSVSAPNIPNPELVWYKDIGQLENATKVVCEVTDTSINRIYLARSPNYVNTPEEPMKTWWSFTGKTTSGDNLILTDANNLVEDEVNHYKGGDVWAIQGIPQVTMCTLWKQKIQDYNPESNSILVFDTNFGGKKCKYYVENTPFLLDSPGEYYYDKIAGRIFIRLEGDRDPNTTTIEVASKTKMLSTGSRNYVVISGLTFGFTTCDDVRFGTSDGNPTVNISSSNVVIKNCKFQYLNGGILANGSGRIFVISDNEMNYMDDFSIFTYGPDEVSILRNKIFESGTRHLSRWYGSIPAVAGNLSVGEIAGNIIEHSWGSAINFTWGKAGSSDADIPFIRGFVHHNKASHTLQGVNDYGGIEAWQGGPVYTYNNISEDAQGWHYDWWGSTERVSLGYAIYLDGSFKNYVFNNIVKGNAWNLNSAAYMHVLGFYNFWVHNNAYNVSELTFSGDGTLCTDGQNYYLANVSDSTNLQFNHTTRVSGIPFESYGNNIFSGRTFQGTFVTNKPNNRFKFDFLTFINVLNHYEPDLGAVGFEATDRVFTNPAAGDFRPTESSELIDNGVKFFAPFPLSKVVGEWHFNRHNSDPTLIKGENFYFTSEFNDRKTYNDVPKNHLKAYGLSENSFVFGELEDWAEGALVFDGIQTYCEAKNSKTSATVCNDVDMTTNNFVLEACFKTVEEITSGCLMSKFSDSGLGYQLDIDETGNVRFCVINSKDVSFSQSGATAVNDGSWHHVLVNVNRWMPEFAIYIDGELSNGTTTGTVPDKDLSLTNAGDLLIGKNKDGSFFSGAVDFIRISKGTLYDAKTTIEELYKWQFDGPFLYDFAGNAPIGQRDAGALEKGVKLCNLAISADPLTFGLTGGTKSFTIDAELGFEVTKKDGSFFIYDVEGNTVNVTANSSNSGTRIGAIYVHGCHETRAVKIIQQPTTDAEILDNDGIKVMPNPVLENQKLSIYVPGNLTSGRVQFMDISGKVITEKTLNGGLNELNVGLSQGMYMVKVFGEETSFTTKLVVN